MLSCRSADGQRAPVARTFIHRAWFGVLTPYVCPGVHGKILSSPNAREAGRNIERLETMLIIHTQKLGVTVAAVILGVLVHSSSANAASFKICTGAHAGTICVNTGNIKLKTLKKGQNFLHQAQSAVPLRDGTYIGT